MFGMSNQQIFPVYVLKMDFLKFFGSKEQKKWDLFFQHTNVDCSCLKDFGAQYI